MVAFFNERNLDFFLFNVFLKSRCFGKLHVSEFYSYYQYFPGPVLVHYSLSIIFNCFSLFPVCIFYLGHVGPCLMWPKFSLKFKILRYIENLRCKKGESGKRKPKS